MDFVNFYLASFTPTRRSVLVSLYKDESVLTYADQHFKGPMEIMERLGVEALPVELHLRDTGTPDWVSMVSHDRVSNLVTITASVVMRKARQGAGSGVGIRLEDSVPLQIKFVLEPNAQKKCYYILSQTHSHSEEA
eukprot:Tamp_24784.p2 GENE.Tamp_24784~~Tamp_24784.p2  ORF type:complete len:136 (+),score=35.49 Tamp_24784:330-737(+)